MVYIRFVCLSSVYDSHISITSQPRPEAPRIPLPVPIATVTGSRTLIPLSGYDCLADLPSVHIEQTFELNDGKYKPKQLKSLLVVRLPFAALTGVSSENRYVVRSPLGDAIFAANESSTEKNRLLWGAGRPFQMHLLDKTHQEALVFRKKLAMGSMCCQAKSLEIWIPPGNLLGKVVQSPTFMQPEFFIEDESTGQLTFCVEGPVGLGFCCFSLPKDCYFKVGSSFNFRNRIFNYSVFVPLQIHSGGNMRASIDHKWLASKSQYTTNIYFSDAKLTAKERALILGSAFLLVMCS